MKEICQSEKDKKLLKKRQAKVTQLLLSAMRMHK